MPICTSIIMVSYNSRAHLARCLPTVLATCGPASEVIIVDNASTDGSADWLAQHYPAIHLVRNVHNEGFAAGTNRGAAQATGRYLVGLNPDTEVTPGWLDALLQPLRDAPTGARVGVTTPRILRMAPRDTINTCGNTMHYTGITVCRGLNRPREAPELAVAREVTAASGACFAVSRVLWATLGGFDATFFTYLEDTDFSLRARLAGYRCLYVPAAVIYHHYAPVVAPRKLYYLERNRLLMLLKCYQARTLWLLLPALALVEVLTWGYALQQGRAGLGAKAGAYRWLLAHRATIARQRRQIQRLRRASDRVVLTGMSWQLDIGTLANPHLARVADRLVNPLFGFWQRVTRSLIPSEV
ncbi:MAG TPA: glycosyltransferase family 2 protein [Chloroflexia bacterium]|nr:glycosyltransferase family 2 protein [Chloroflexia bacterium]